MNADKFLLCVLALLSSLWFSSCATTRPPTQAEIARDQRIAAEPLGNYYIGRRFFIRSTQLWGYVRKPRQKWADAELVVINESRRRTPDRLPEAPADGKLPHGYDHNYEYRLQGYFSGDRIYDPNSNLKLKEFVLTGYELRSRNSGFLFREGEKYDGKRLLRAEKLY